MTGEDLKIGQDCINDIIEKLHENIAHFNDKIENL